MASFRGNAKSLLQFFIIPMTVVSVILCANDNTSLSHKPDDKDWISLQARYCCKTCQDGVFFSNDNCTSLECSTCDCDEYCDLLGTCCPSYNKTTDTYHFRFEQTIENNPHRWYDKLECRIALNDDDRMYLTVARCDESWPDSTIRDKCENPTQDSMESIIPLIDKTTRIVFTNVYCAVCNGLIVEDKEGRGGNSYTLNENSKSKHEKKSESLDERLTSWKLEAGCPQFQTMYTITDEYQFYKALPENNCTLEFKVTDFNVSDLRSCNQPVIRTPQVTSSDPCVNPDNLRRCFSVPPAPSLTVEGDSNLFCHVGCGPFPQLSVTMASIIETDSISYGGMSENIPPMYLLFNPFLKDKKANEELDEIDNDVILTACPLGSWRDNQGNCTETVCTPGKVWDRTGNSPACKTALPDIREFGYKGNCTEAVCTPGKLLDLTGNFTACKTAIPNIRGLGYKVRLILIALTDIGPDDLRDVEIAIREGFNKIAKKASLRMSYTAIYCPDSEESDGSNTLYRKIVEVHIRGSIVAGMDKSRDEFEKYDLGYLLQTRWKLRIKNPTDGVERLVVLQLVSVGQPMSWLYRNFEHQEERRGALQHFLIRRSGRSIPLKTHVTQNVSNHSTDKKTPNKYLIFGTDVTNLRDSRSFRQFYKSPRNDDATRFNPVQFNDEEMSFKFGYHHRHARKRRSEPGSNPGSKMKCIVEYLPRPIVVSIDEELRDYTFNVMKFQDQFIDVVPKLRCPFIEVNLHSYSKNKNGSLEFMITYQGKQIKFPFVSPVVSYEDNKVFICLDFLTSLTQRQILGRGIFYSPTGSKVHSEIIHPVKTDLILEITYYTDITCNVISIVCLSLTFLTYSLFSTLRSLPGRNNMCLCASLATAQLTLIITSVFGARGHMHPTHCLIHSIVLHYSWLSAFCWMNTCCVHMYRVFTSSRCPSAWSESKTHLHYCLYSFGIPVIIVILTIVLSHTISQGKTIGYNDKMCILDVSVSPLISVLSLLTPFGITMIINTFLFFRTVKEIVHVTRLQQNTLSTRSASQGVMTYFKLSTVTGLFWTFQVSAVLTSNRILMLTATPFAGLQGVFIFASFTFNKKIAGLYMEMVGYSSSSESSRSSDRLVGSEGTGKRVVKQQTLTSSV